MSTFFNDIRYAIRQLRKNPGFAATTVITLALCIGANSAILSALYDLMLKPLPFKDADRLYQVRNVEENGARLSNSSWSQYLDFKRQADLFEGFALLYGIHKPMVLNSGTRQVKGQSVSADLFEVMGVTPVLGRFFHAEENRRGNHVVAVLPQTVWEQEYDADPDVIGQTLRFSGEAPYTIVGVAPRSMEVFDYEAKFFTPFVADAQTLNPQTRYLWPVDLWARLKTGVSREAGLAQLKAIDRRWLDEVANPERRARNEGRIDQIELARSVPFKMNLMMMQGGALFVLLIGLVNVVNLMLIRAGRQRHELSLRHGLGASLFTLCRTTLVESGLLAGMAALVGAGVTWVGLRVINGYVAALTPGAPSIGVSLPIFSAMLFVVVGVAILMGLLPVLWLWRTGQITRIKHGNRSSSVGGDIRAFSRKLVVGQVAIAFTLLIGAGLLLSSLSNVLAVDPGFAATQVVRGRVDLGGQYPREERAAVRRRVLAAMQEIPGVENVAWTHFESFNLGVDHRRHPYYLKNIPEMAEAGVIFPRQEVSANYFATMGIPILQGRPFRKSDTGGWLVDETFARRYFPEKSGQSGQSAVGAELFYQPQGPDDGGPWPRILGVVGRANLEGLEARDGQAVIYGLAGENTPARSFTLLLRAAGPVSSVMRDIRAKLKEIDAMLPLSGVGVLQETLDRQLFERRGITLLLSCFAGIALLLSTIGVYGVLAYDVLQRTREIGIRVTLGASRDQVLKMIMQQGLGKVGIGLLLGVGSAILLSRYLTSLLFDVTSLDPVTYLGVSVLLLTVALVASYIPARRATKIDPMEALRNE